MAYKECWGLYENQVDGQPLSVRLNEDIGDYVCHSRYMYQVSIMVPLNETDEKGFPYPEEGKLLDELELVLKDRLETQQVSIFAAVITTDGFRLYILYTGMPEFCQQAVEDTDNDWIYHQLSSVSHEDKNWETIEALIKTSHQQVS